MSRMGKKYIIELERGETAYKTVDSNGKPMIQLLAPTPYTEPDLDAIRKEAYDKAFEDAEQVAESGKRAMYQKGLNDAWEAARKITGSVMDGSLNYNELNVLFGSKYPESIINKYSASECIEKIRQYEQEKEEIQVGDEVVGTYTDEEETEPFVIIRKIPETHPIYYFGIYSKSGEFCQGGLKLKKTGRHFPEIAEVLQKMKE